MTERDLRRLWLFATDQITRQNAETLDELRAALDREATDHPIRRDLRAAAWFILSCDRLGVPRPR